VSQASASVTIASGQTVSTALSVAGMDLVAVLIPSVFTGTTITFQGSIDGSTFSALYNHDGTAYSLTNVAASRLIQFTANDFIGMNYIKLVSNSSEGADRTIICSLRAIA